MSNGVTDVIYTALIVAGSQLAQTAREIEFVLWLAQLDQGKVSAGCVGFDISEMPWSFEAFESEKAFLLKLIEQAQSNVLKEGIQALEDLKAPAGYFNRCEFWHGELESFRMFVFNFYEEDLRSARKIKIKLYRKEGYDKTEAEEMAANDPRRRVGMPVQFEKCTKHGIYLSKYGCFVCESYRR